MPMAPIDRSEIMRRVRSRDTGPERRLQEALAEAGIAGWDRDDALPGKPDLVFAEQRLVVFIDGDYWHGNQWRLRGLTCLEEQFPESENRAYWLRKIRRNMERDRTRTAALLDSGWRVLRLWESDIVADVAACVTIIDAALRRRGAPTPPGPFDWTLLTRKTVAEFFAGIGLVRLGLEAEQWQTRFANDIDAKKQAMYLRNFPDPDGGPPVFVRDDIHALDGGAIPAVTLATASFPCTDLSLAGARRGLAGVQSGAFWGFVRAMEAMAPRRPPLILIENVQGFLTSHQGGDFDRAVRALADLGYTLDAFMIDAAWLVPQSRPRLFLVGMAASNGNDQGLDGCARRPSPLRPPRLLGAMERNRDVPWRLAPLPTVAPEGPRPELLALLEPLPDASPLWWPEDKVDYLLSQMNPLHRDRAEALRQASEAACGTVFRRVRQGRTRAELRCDGLAGCLRTPRGGSSRQILCVGSRGRLRARLLTPRECARLQGAPDTFDLSGVRANQAIFGLGDAVCAPAITWIARHVLDPIVQSLLRGRLLEPPR